MDWTNEYADHVHGFATEMCRGRDLACSRDVLAQYTRYIRSGGPTDESSRRAAQEDGARLADCAAALESTSARPVT